MEAEENKQLTKEELEAVKELVALLPQLKEIVKSEERARWFWSSVRVWALTAATLIAPVLLAWDRLVEYIKAH